MPTFPAAEPLLRVSRIPLRNFSGDKDQNDLQHARRYIPSPHETYFEKIFS
ncbi:MAG TPA: hypothetical protein VFH91_07835 [Pyrinomonadaceae bacterium]|nr:hypothetical protein [Pyrinomonadaceae bacterium]